METLKFRFTGLLWGESTGYLWIPSQKASDAELWCFLRCAAEQTVESRVIWGAMTPMWGHYNAKAREATQEDMD